jgi:hypothetical protein
LATGVAGQARHLLQRGLAGLGQHEARQRLLGALERHLHADLVLVVGLEGLAPDLSPTGA